jgi:hypothetical protein
VFSDANRQFDLIFNAIAITRSLAASYNVQNDIHGMWSVLILR